MRKMIGGSLAENIDEFVSQVILSHASHLLRGYRNNLSGVIEVVDNNWLPASGDASYDDHIAALRDHMQEIGQPENDLFLLRFGLTVPGRHRSKTPPLVVLAESHGGFGARRKREAEGQIGRVREALAIGQHFVAELGGDTETAIRQLLSWCESAAGTSDPDWLTIFGQLSNAQAKQLAEQALNFLDSDHERVQRTGADMLQRVACFRQPPLELEVCLKLIERGVFYPSSIFRDAGDVVAARLIEQIHIGIELNEVNHILLALAWTRSEVAEAAFRAWANDPPPWASVLYVAPEAYTVYAGWSYDENGGRRDLITTQSYRLLSVEESHASAVPCRTKGQEDCPSCGCQLSLLFEFSQLNDTYFGGELGGAPRRVLFCPNNYDTFYSSYSPDGAIAAHSVGEACDSDNAFKWEPMFRVPSAGLSLPFACAEPFAFADVSTLGGVPSWLQDACYPRCFECDREMFFLAQHDNIDEEGIYYAFFCGRCRVAAVNYQQT